MGFRIAIFTLNQWANDFEGNTNRIIESIKRANDVGAIYRAGPELEICGYSLEDAFFESYTIRHCWSCLWKILDATKDLEIVIDVGMPVQFGSLYNCRIICYRGRVKCIRAKTSLAQEGNYREFRHFTPWPADSGVTMFRLPNSDTLVPFGASFVLQLSSNFNELRIGHEICQELWDMKNTSSRLYCDFDCHLVVNGSGSYWEVRKLEVVNDMIKGISLRSGACYAFSNLVGCDGQRVMFSGRSCIYDNGKLICITPGGPDIFEEIQMITHTVYPEKISEHRAQMGIRLKSSARNSYDLNSHAQAIDQSTNYLLLTIDTSKTKSQNLVSSVSIDPKITTEMEIHYYAALYLWDYLRKSKMRGFMLPLSGGSDSSTVAMLVYGMCVQLYNRIHSEPVKSYFSSCHDIPVEKFTSPEKICSILLRCRYLSTQYSGRDTERRARVLAQSIGADFDVVSIQDLFDICRKIAGKKPNDSVDLRDQNVQARLRMLLTYYLKDDDMIVLATGNVDEAIMGYYTKYDCSSGDVNPIGGLCKSDLKAYLLHCSRNIYGDKPDMSAVLEEIIGAPPSAELTGDDQRDEDEIGITYDEISILGRVRRGIYGCSDPSGAFETIWRNRDNPEFNKRIRCLKPAQVERSPGQIAHELGELVKRFYQRYTRNRHKLTTLTPALHAETYSPDDNRFDHRQILYPPLTVQFKAIDSMVGAIEISGDL